MNTKSEVLNAVTIRFMYLQRSFKERDEDSHYYNGPRTSPSEVAKQFVFNHPKDIPDIDKINCGEYDKEIEEVYHERARCDYHYKFDKDYGN